MLKIQRIVNNPISSNCYVLYDKKYGDDCVIIDPGSRTNQALLIFLAAQSLLPKYIILTHEHFDHCWGVNYLVELYHVPIICSRLCAVAIKNFKKNCSLFYDCQEAFTIQHETIDIDSFETTKLICGCEMRYYFTPGHTESSISLLFGGFLFTGDTLIKDSCTITKLPTGSTTQLMSSYNTFSQMKGGGYVVFPGHGDIFSLDSYNLEQMFKGSISYNG